MISLCRNTNLGRGKMELQVSRSYGSFTFFFKNNLVDKIKACAVKASITKMNKISRCEDMSSQWILAIQPARSGIPGKKYKSTTFTCQLRFFVGVSSNKNR